MAKADEVLGGGPKTKAAFAQYMARRASGNAEKMEKNSRFRAEREGTVDIEKEEEMVKKTRQAAAKVATSDLYRAVNCPLLVGRETQQLSVILQGLVAAVEVRSLVQGVSTKPKISGTVTECDEALAALVIKDPVGMNKAMKGLSRNVLSWVNRAAGAFIFLHPAIYGEGDLNSRLEKVATAIGAGKTSVARWFSLQNYESKSMIEKWLPLVENMAWGDVSKCFAPSWVKQWNLDATATVKEQLKVYEQHVKGSVNTYLSKFTPGTKTAGRKSKAKRDGNTLVLKKLTKYSGRSDVDKGRKYEDQEDFTLNLVSDRWKLGDPIGKIELKGEIISREDCDEGTEFYNNYLDPEKGSAASGFTNWLKRCLERAGWSLRKNSVGQTVPEDWRQKAEANAKRIRERFKEEDVEVTINADQTFVNFFMEETQVVAPKGTKRVGGKIKADVKKGFTLMVACNMDTSKIEAPFSVFNGTKLCKAKYPERTLAYKHRDWRNLAPGKTGKTAFQQKHWFDEDITMEWFDWQLDVLYPGKKVGISLDMAPAHQGGRVKAYIDRRTAEGRLVVEAIDGGLTSILQVCDLTANKEIKSLTQKGYLKCRKEFIKAERAKTPDEPNRRITMKVPIVKMMEIIEEAVKEFNNRQRETESIKKTFISSGQHPWQDCEEDFQRHLDNLSKLPLYGGCKSTKDLLEEKAIQTCTGLQLTGELVQETGEAAEEKEVAAEKEATATKEVVDLSLEDEMENDLPFYDPDLLV